MKRIYLLASLSVLLLLGAGCARQDANKQTSAVDNTSPTPVADARVMTTLTIKELGITLQIPEIYKDDLAYKINDLNYEIKQVVPLGTVAYLYSKSVLAKDSNCGAGSIGAISIGKKLYNNATGEERLLSGTNTIKIGNEYVTFDGPQDRCTDDKELQKAISLRINALRGALPTVEGTENQQNDLGASASDEPRVLTAAETDASWETYTSKTFGFTMMTPTKGKYAPRWEMKVVEQNDPAMKDGCYYPLGFGKGVPNFQVATQEKVTFCQTHNSDSGMGQAEILDSYATLIGTKIAVIEFTKHVVSTDRMAETMDCAGKMTEPYSLSATTCIPFVESEYQATLDGIVGTFKMNAIAQ